MMGCYDRSVIKHDKKYFRKILWEAEYEELLTTDIMISKPSFMLTTRKGFFFPPMENMDALLAVCKRMCAIKRLDQLAYARVKLLPTPPEKSGMLCLLHWCYLKKKKTQKILKEIKLYFVFFLIKKIKRNFFKKIINNLLEMYSALV